MSYLFDFGYNFVDSVAHFLESRGMIEDALEVATDPDYKFELAIQLGKLEIAKVNNVNLFDWLVINLTFTYVFLEHGNFLFNRLLLTSFSSSRPKFVL